MSTLFCAPDLEVLTESSKNRDSSANAVDELNRASSTQCSAIAFVVSRTLYKLPNACLPASGQLQHSQDQGLPACFSRVHSPSS